MILRYYNILCSLDEKVRMCPLRAILVGWLTAKVALGGLSTCKMLALHPNMSLGLCATEMWRVTVLIYS